MHGRRSSGGSWIKLLKYRNMLINATICLPPPLLIFLNNSPDTKVIYFMPGGVHFFHIHPLHCHFVHLPPQQKPCSPCQQLPVHSSMWSISTPALFISTLFRLTSTDLPILNPSLPLHLHNNFTSPTSKCKSYPISACQLLSPTTI